MALLRPLVIQAGEPQRLQPGDGLIDGDGNAILSTTGLTTNIVPKFDGTHLVDSAITDDGTSVSAYNRNLQVGDIFGGTTFIQMLVSSSLLYLNSTMGLISIGDSNATGNFNTIKVDDRDSIISLLCAEGSGSSIILDNSGDGGVVAINAGVLRLNIGASNGVFFSTGGIVSTISTTGLSTFLNTPTSANFAALVTDEIGTGSVLFNTGITAFSLRDTSAAFNLVLEGASSTALTVQRKFTIDVDNGNRVLKLSGNLTVGVALSFTGTGGTIMTFPAASATVAGLGTTQTFTGINTFSPAARTSGSASYLVINGAADTGISTTAESIGVDFAAVTRTWADGTVTTQRERYFRAPTYNKTTTAAVFSTAINVEIEDPVAGTGVTFTNKYALRVNGTVAIGTTPSIKFFPSWNGTGGWIDMSTGGASGIGSGGAGQNTWVGYASSAGNWFADSVIGDVCYRNATGKRIIFGIDNGSGNANAQFVITAALLTFGDSVNLAFNATTGTKIGTATSQKFAFWNATPIVQPTTSVTAATFVAGAGTAVNDASTFDGYTIGKAIKALRNMGALA